MRFVIVVACDINRGIGIKNAIPWFLPSEFRWLYRITTHTSDPDKMNALLMGRKTWDSIPVERRPLAKRINIILSRTSGGGKDGELFFSDLDSVLDFLDRTDSIETCYIFGGAHIYEECLSRGIVDEVIETEIQKSFFVDTWMPSLPDSFALQRSESLILDGIPVVRRTYENRKSQK